MKKMIFSAVALVAFSVSGMANEIEEKKIQRDCKNELSIAMNHAYTSGSDIDEAYAYGLAIYDLCTTGALDAIYSIRF